MVFTVRACNMEGATSWITFFFQEKLLYLMSLFRNVLFSSRKGLFQPPRCWWCHLQIPGMSSSVTFPGPAPTFVFSWLL